MKIAYFTNNYLPHISGVGISIERFKKELERRGHEVYIFAPSFDGCSGLIKKQADEPDRRIFRYLSLQTNFKISFPIAILPSAKIRKIISQINPDLFHAHHYFWVGDEALKFTGKNQRPVLFTRHTNFEFYTHYIPLVPKGLLDKFARKKEVRFCNKCSAIIAPAKGVKETLIERGVKKPIYVVPTGAIDAQSFKEIDAVAAKAKYGIKEDDITLIFLGRLEKEKNIDLLISMMPSLLEKYNNLKFIIAGYGSEEKKIRAVQNNFPQRTVITGKLTTSEVIEYLKAADIFLQTSLSETHGMTTTEAMAAGLCVVAVKSKGGASELIIHNKNGILTDPAAQSFQKELEKVIEDKELRNNIKEQALASAQEMDIRKCADKLLNVYEKFVKKD